MNSPPLYPSGSAARSEAGDQQVVSLTRADLDELSAALQGPVFLPGQDGYDAERVAFNLALDPHPALVVGATGAADVMATVGFAAQRGLPVGVIVAGHQASVPADGAVLISTQRMRGVRVDPAASTARVEAGVRWGAVVHEASPFGLAPLNGSAPQVGAVPYTLGGGLGMLGRRYGFAVDHVRQFDVVTADGRLRQATAEQEPDLFWALRGGKGNFGVVVSMEFDLMPVARLYGGGLYFAGESAATVLHAYCDWTATVPDGMGSSVLLAQLPPIPEMPEPLRGRFVAAVRVAYAGSVTDGRRLVQPLRDLAPRIIDTVDDMPYSAVGTIHSDPTEPMPSYDSSALLGTLDHAAVDTLLELGGPDAKAPYIVELRHLGGAYARPPAVPSAIGNRNAAFTVFCASVIDPSQAEQVEAIRAAHERVRERLRPWSAGRVPVSFMGITDAAPERVRLAYQPRDYARLAELKTRFDPENVFRINHNIPPNPPGSSG